MESVVPTLGIWFKGYLFRAYGMVPFGREHKHRWRLTVTNLLLTEHMHAKGLMEDHEANPLYKHVQTSHENESVKFDYERQKFFSDTLRRQIDEGIRINVDLM